MNYTVVSYYTKNSGYKGEAHRLKASLKKFNIPYHIAEVPCLGSWDLNTRYKAKFIEEMLDFHDMPVVWLDADAEVYRYPILFETLDCDMAVLRNQSQMLMSGTMFVNNTDDAREILGLWQLENKYANIKVYEQYNLAKVLRDAEAVDRNFNVENLPEEYVYVDGIFNHPDPVIWHHQASRRLKREIDDKP